jgi:hypothetical protein
LLPGRQSFELLLAISSALKRSIEIAEPDIYSLVGVGDLQRVVFLKEGINEFCSDLSKYREPRLFDKGFDSGVAAAPEVINIFKRLSLCLKINERNREKKTNELLPTEATQPESQS